MEKKATYLIYTDESGAYKQDRNERFLKSHPFYVRSNVFISIEDNIFMRNKVNELKMQRSLSPKVEVKWSHYGSKLKESKFHLPYDFSIDEYKEYFTEVITEFCNRPTAKVFCSITDNQLAIDLDEIKLIKLHMQNALQRAQVDMEKENSYAILIADDLGDKTKILKAAMYDLILEGDRLTSYSRVNDGILIDDSSQSTGLQIADLCAGILTASIKFLRAEENEKRKYEFGYSLFIQQLYKKIRFDDRFAPHLETYPYGIKEIPDSLGRELSIALARIVNEKLDEQGRG